MRFKHICLLSLAACVQGFASTPSTAVSAIPAWFEELPGGGYSARGTEGHLVLGGTQAKLAFRTGTAAGDVERMSWILLDANHKAQPQGGALRTATSNYFIGNDRRQWRQGAAHYGEVRVPRAYPGIDVVWYASGRLLEYDFVVAPGADPKPIRFQLQGANPRLNRDGDLEYDLGRVKVRQGRPVAFQMVAGVRKPVDARYQLLGDGSVKIRLGRYDKTETLVIDPVLSYSGYLGGTGVDVATGVAIDSSGAVWVAGSASSDVDSAWVKEPYDTTRNGSRDAFLARIVPDEAQGWKLDHWSYFGGASDDESVGLVITADGVLYMAGRTFSSDFPMAGNSAQTENKGEGDVFVLRYNPFWDGYDTLEYASFLGTAAAEVPLAVAANANGWVTVAGYTSAGELPEGALNSPLQPSNRGGTDAFVFTFNTRGEAGETLLMATLYGGYGTDLANAVEMDEAGRVYVAGMTMSSDLPLDGPSYQAEYHENGDAFLVILDPSQAAFDQLKYATFFGGYDLDVAMGMKRTADGLIWLTGYTVSDDFPLSPGAFQTMKMGYVDAWVAAVDPTKAGADFVKYSSYLGGEGTEVGYAVTQGPDGKITVGGYTNSYDFPVKNPPVTQSLEARGIDAFITSLDPAIAGAAALDYSALFGGKGTEVVTALATGANGATAIAGYSTSSDLPVSKAGGKPNAAGLKTSFFILLNPDFKP
jgi:hypothetical protein